MATLLYAPREVPERWRVRDDKKGEFVAQSIRRPAWADLPLGEVAAAFVAGEIQPESERERVFLERLAAMLRAPVGVAPVKR